MSWVITRTLCKSGGNNISYRIGQFNKWSSPKAMCKYISNNLIHSGLLETFQKKKNIKIYSTIDKYVTIKSLYHIGHSRKKVWESKIALIDMWAKLYTHEIIYNYKSGFSHWYGSFKKYGPIIHKKFIKRNKKYNSMNYITSYSERYTLKKYIFIGIIDYKNNNNNFNSWWWSYYN